MKIQIKKLHPEAKVPSFAHVTDAGMDLCTTEAFVLEPGVHHKASTGLAFAVPADYVGLIWDKGGVSMVRHIKTMGGVLDSDYRGELHVGLVNLGSEPQSFAVGDKIAQLLIQRIEHPEIRVVEELDNTRRGEGRFGSTGK